MSGQPSNRTTFDESRWPIVLAKAPKEPLEGAAFDEHCRTTFGYFERGQSFAFVLDTRSAASLTAAQRRIIAEQTDRSATKYPGVTMYCAIVLNSAVQRGIVKAITWLSRQPVPTEVFATPEEGIAWASELLAVEGRTHSLRK